MEPQPTKNKKVILINLVLFNILYIALVLAERQLIRKGFLGYQLPFELDILKVLAGFALGSILTVGLSLLLKKQSWVLRLVLIGVLILGSIYLNYFLYSQLYYLPFTTTSTGDLQELGEDRWQHDYAYSMYSAVFDKYYLQTIVVNPEIEGLEELSRVLRFGVYLKESSHVPASIDLSHFSQIEKTWGGNYQLLTRDDLEYRMYNVDPSEEILLTLYEDMIIFLPVDFMAE